jgi:hypothetical protein
MIHIYSEPQKDMRLKAYSAVTKGGVSVLRIDIAITDGRVLGFVLRELAELEAAQKAEAARVPRERRLPAPSDREGEA